MAVTTTEEKIETISESIQTRDNSIEIKTETISNTNSDSTMVTLKAMKPPEFKAKMQEMRNSHFFTRGKDVGLLNETTGESIVIRNGSFNQSPSQNVSAKTIGNGPQQQTITQGNEHRIITNRLRMDTDEVVLNSHKLNPWLWEYTDMKNHQDQYGTTFLAGNFCLFGTVMVKAWDHQLGKYVLIRRLARMPMFGPTLDVPQIAEGLDIIDDTERPVKYTVKQKTESAKEFYNRIAGQVAAQNKNQTTGTNNTTTQQTTGSTQVTDPTKPDDKQIDQGTSNSPGRINEAAEKAEEAKREAGRAPEIEPEHRADIQESGITTDPPSDSTTKTDNSTTAGSSFVSTGTWKYGNVLGSSAKDIVDSIALGKGNTKGISIKNSGRISLGNVIQAAASTVLSNGSENK